MALPTLDQLTGSLLGLALGDALGAVVEAHPPEDARRYVETCSAPDWCRPAGRERSRSAR